MTEKELESQLAEWFGARIPKEWFTSPAEVSADDHEILVVGQLGDPRQEKAAAAEAKEAARSAKIREFRDSSREERISIAAQAERLFNRKVSWGAACGDVTKMFTGLGVPVMTRLRLTERSLLDTLVSSGVARSRSEALSWCVGLVASRQKDWIEDLRKATKQVDKVRRKGPDLTTI